MLRSRSWPSRSERTRLRPIHQTHASISQALPWTLASWGIPTSWAHLAGCLLCCAECAACLAASCCLVPAFSSPLPTARPERGVGFDDPSPAAGVACASTCEAAGVVGSPFWVYPQRMVTTHRYTFTVVKGPNSPWDGLRPCRPSLVLADDFGRTGRTNSLHPTCAGARGSGGEARLETDLLGWGLRRTCMRGCARGRWVGGGRDEHPYRHE